MLCDDVRDIIDKIEWLTDHSGVSRNRQTHGMKEKTS